ncbi:MAG: molecular chaperone HtpG [Proteobacteria bacterium]|nr:molecular chaperone HtpG [Pseudomonadota bacterium]
MTSPDPQSVKSSTGSTSNPYPPSSSDTVSSQSQNQSQTKTKTKSKTSKSKKGGASTASAKESPATKKAGSKVKEQSFQAEVKQILDLVIHSLYSQKEIFLRELISNAADAIEKRRVAALKDASLAFEKSPEIWLSVDSKAKTLTISDPGIGMSRAEVEKNIGTIAHSGTKEFSENLGKLKENPELIGQFGVGFYASFMVAEKVSLHTQKAGSDVGTFWESTGDGTYKVSEKVKKDGVGTSITLRLKVFSDEEEVQDFTDHYVLTQVVKRYSDFIEFPVKMMVEKTEPVLDSDGKPIDGKSTKKTVEETLNSMKALWRKPASKITKEEYEEFYKSTCKDWSAPLEVIHYKAEGVQEFRALLFVPSQVPFDYNQREMKWGPSLYIKKVFIAENVSDLLPTYLRFVKGVVDSDDIPLNVSREMLQKDHRLQALSKALLHKVLKHFASMLKKDRAHYEKFWELWGASLKEGIAVDFAQKDNLDKILLFRTSLDDRLTTLDEYVERMKADQKDMYYLTGESLSQLRESPHMEKFKEKSYEVLLMVDPVDEWVVQNLRKYADKDVKSITQDDLDLDKDSLANETNELKKKKLEEEKKKQNEAFASLCKTMQSVLDADIKEVKLSSRLVGSAVCLVSSQFDPSSRMQKLMGSMGQNMPKTKRILEINPDHPVLQKMKLLDEDAQKRWSHILYNQALLNEGSSIEDPKGFVENINELMVKASG